MRLWRKGCNPSWNNAKDCTHDSGGESPTFAYDSKFRPCRESRTFCPALHQELRRVLTVNTGAVQGTTDTNSGARDSRHGDGKQGEDGRKKKDHTNETMSHRLEEDMNESTKPVNLQTPGRFPQRLVLANIVAPLPRGSQMYKSLLPTTFPHNSVQTQTVWCSSSCFRPL